MVVTTLQAAFLRVTEQHLVGMRWEGEVRMERMETGGVGGGRVDSINMY